MLLGAALGETGKPDLDIPADGPAIEVLRRIQTRSASLLPVQSFPQNESAAVAAGNPAASPADAYRLQGLLPSRRRELLRWADSARSHSLFASPSLEIGWQSSERDGSDTRVLTGLGLTLYGKLFPGLAYYSRGAVYTEFTDRAQFSHQFDPEYGETYSVDKGSGDSLVPDRTFNRYEHYILWDLPWVKFKIGRDRIHSGPGYFSSLMATRDTPPYYLAEARVDFAPWLRLDDYLIRMTDTRHDILKYASLHRFEFRPLRGLSLAFQDIVIYQDRDPDWRFVLPLSPLAFSEDNTGGGDNDAMGFDFLYAGIPFVSAWGELFIDDLQGPDSFFDDYWENRWATLAGFQLVSPWPGFDADLVVEWSHVEPWTYIGTGTYTSFKHFNVPSASKLGPDSRSWDFKLSWRPARMLQVSERIEIDDKGTGPGSVLGQPHRSRIDPDTKSFLGGNVVSDRVFTHQFEAWWSRYLSARLWWSQYAGSRPGNAAGLDLKAQW